MGCCLSKTDPISTPPPNPNPNPTPNPYPAPVEKVAAVEGDERVEVSVKEVEKLKKKEVFVIQHRKSNDKRCLDSDGSGSGSDLTDPNSSNNNNNINNNDSNILAVAASGQAVRTSSCTKEEVDAILIQCGRLSRSSSGAGKRYSGSKRSYDFERENEVKYEVSNDGKEDEEEEEDGRLRRRQSRGASRRRSTPSRSRERVDKTGGGGGGSSSRRVSRSPQRRSESPMNGRNVTVSGKALPPGKMVTVPATVTSLSSGGEVKRVLVKRNVGSPRSQSPARGNGNGGNMQQQQQSLSRNGSRKAEHSPYRRTPLNDIDMNSLPFQPLANKRLPTKGKEVEDDGVIVKQALNSSSQNKYAETNNAKVGGQVTHRRTGSRGAEGYEITKTNYCRVNELQTPPSVEPMTESKLDPISPGGYDAMVTPVILSGSETLKLPQTLMRSRSSRRSRDLDINVDALLTPNPTTNYNSLLLQDIQNFHQKNGSNSNSNSSSNSNSNSNGNPNNSNNGTTTPYTLPPCVSKACSILEAVADLNSSTKTNPNPNSNPNYSFHNGKKRLDRKDPFLESEVKMGDDLMEPSMHKYVTVRKAGGELEDEESSGSNSFIGGVHQNWISSSSWEPTSADSTDCWTSKSYSKEEGFSPVGFQRLAISDMVETSARVGRGSVQTS